MSHKDEQVICPNCGFHTSENYCARCGQETHLHSETFFGLIMHFIGHYFHYDSKFWKTIAALWTSPGKLTIAYWNKQRMRYIPPISLYIFISVVFFIAYTSLPARHSSKTTTVTVSDVDSTFAEAEAEVPAIGRSAIHSFRNKLDQVDTTGDSDSTTLSERAKAEKVVDTINKHSKEIKEKAFHMMPKLFFFLIPIMGMVLFLLFIKRKELNYASHIIFALHYHSFWFSLMLLEQAYRFHIGHSIVVLIAFIISEAYLVIALKKVYGIGWVKSVLYSFIVGMVYALCFLIAISILFAFIARSYQ